MIEGSGIVRIGDWVLTGEELFRSLAEHQLLMPLMQGIIIDQAIAGVSCTSEETAQWVQEFWQSQQVTTPEQQQEWLQRHYLTAAQVVTVATRPHRLQRFKEMTWGAAVESYFLKRKEQLDRVVYSLIRTQDGGVAQELYFRISEGEQAFAEAAKEFSQGAEAATGGLIGPMPLGKLHPSLKKLLAVSQPGQVWPPVQLGPWWVVVRLEKLLPAQLDEATRQQLVDELFHQWLEQQLNPSPPQEPL